MKPEKFEPITQATASQSPVTLQHGISVVTGGTASAYFIEQR
jgi:hypothetical protein